MCAEQDDHKHLEDQEHERAAQIDDACSEHSEEQDEDGYCIECGRRPCMCGARCVRCDKELNESELGGVRPSGFCAECESEMDIEEGLKPHEQHFLGIGMGFRYLPEHKQ
jgi:hypothetical protein